MAGVTTETAIPGLDPTAYRQHTLHGEAVGWPETNCYIDLWIEVLHSLALDPIALLPFCLSFDFEGDQWTFSRPSLEDIWNLYNIDIQELNIFDAIVGHVAVQVGRGRLPLVEVDAFYLPDTRGISYRTEHTKTTIAVNAINLGARRMEYFHNSGYFAVEGDDFADALRITEPIGDSHLPPYVEFAKFDRRVALAPPVLRGKSLDIVCRRIGRLPVTNPVTRWRPVFAADVDRLLTLPIGTYHRYAFATLRQLGAACQLNAVYLRWLATDDDSTLLPAADAFERISHAAKALLLKMARSINRGKPMVFDALVDSMEADWKNASQILVASFDRSPCR